VANNRMQLLCGECGERITLCKYYPSTGWYTFGPTFEKPYDGESRLTDWLAEHAHAYEGSMFGQCHFRMGYEVEGE